MKWALYVSVGVGVWLTLLTNPTVDWPPVLHTFDHD